MQVTFSGQPFEEWDQTGRVIAAALGDSHSTRFWAAVAWAKHSGLSRLQNDILRFRAAGGYAEIILGVDEGGATVEGLSLALKLFDEAHVFHDPGQRTFHPKIYAVEGASSATLIVGSGNATKGGLFTNFEAGLVVNLELSDECDAALLSDVRAYFDRLGSDAMFCRPLDADLVDSLIEDPRIRVTPERLANTARKISNSESPSGAFGRKAMKGLKGAPPAAEDLDDDFDDDRLTAGEEPDKAATQRQPSNSQQPGPPATATLVSADVLVAEIPKNAPNRLQADVGREFFVSFFGGTPGAAAQVQIRPVDPSGHLGLIESRALIGTKSHNYRLELADGRSTPYPTVGRPIGLFSRMSSGIIAYIVLWPTDVAHPAVEALLTARFGPAGHSMRRTLVAKGDIVSAWPACPLP